MTCKNCEAKEKELVMVKELYKDILERFNKLAMKMLEIQTILGRG